MRGKKCFLLTLLSLSLLPVLVPTIWSAEAIPETKRLNPTADSTVSTEGPDYNRGRDQYLITRGRFGPVLTFVMFDLSQIPPGVLIERAMLRLYSHGVDVKCLVSVHFSQSNEWTEKEITYGNKPSFEASSIDTAYVTQQETWYEWNVTNSARLTFDNADKRLSLVLEADTIGRVWFDSRNRQVLPPSPTTRPQLAVVYHDPLQSGNAQLQEDRTLEPTADSQVMEAYAGFGTSEFMQVSSHQETLAFLMFDVSQIPSTASIDWAKLELHVVEGSTRHIVGVYYCPSNDWGEFEITYNNMPSFSETPIDTANITMPQSIYEWNLTDTVKSTLQSSDKRLSLVLKADTPSSVEFYSGQNPYSFSYYPELAVSYTAPPQTGIYIPKELIIIIVGGAAAIGLTLAYVYRKRKTNLKTTSKSRPMIRINTTQPKPN